MRLLKLSAIVVVLSVAYLSVRSEKLLAQTTSRIGERPTLEEHIKESDIESGSIKFKNLVEIGEFIFAARWTKLDGQGRPAATGNGTPSKRDVSHDPGF